MEQKKIEDYLHLYIGCQCRFRFPSVAEFNTMIMTGMHVDRGLTDSECVPILRPLSSMTEDEETEHSKMRESGWTSNTEQQMLRDAAGTKYLLSKSFDLFGLIESGLALDATKLKQHEED